MGNLLADSFLQALYFPSYPSDVPLHSNMQPVCVAGSEEAWPFQGELSCRPANIALSSVGRLRSRPRTLNIMLLDCHSHKVAPYPEGIISGTPDTVLMPGQLYSLGIHPKDLPSVITPAVDRLALLCVSPCVVAVGEAGLDAIADTPMWLQIKGFEQQAILAERLGKPLMVHCVRRAQEVAQLRRDLRASVPWIIHGFRGKPTVLKILLDAGCYISYGEYFNQDSLRATPPEFLLAETDESQKTITEIIEALGVARGEDLFTVIAENNKRLFDTYL